MERSSRLFAALFALLSLTFAATGTATTYIVAPSGGNFTTIQAALNVAVAGDVILVRNKTGGYNEKITFPRSGNATAGYITLMADAGATPIIDGSGLGVGDMVLIPSRSYVKIIGFEIRDNLNVNDASGIRVTGAGSFIEIRNNRIHDIHGTDAMGITVYGTEATPISNLIIDGNEIYDCDPADSEALVLNGNVTDFEVTNNFVHDVNNIGIDFIGGETDIQPDPALVARNGVCRGNRVFSANHADGYAGGIYVDGGKDIIIENNIVSECDLGIEIGAEKLGLVTSGVIVRNNLIYLNQKAGLVFGGYGVNRGRTNNCQFFNNVCYKNNDGVNFYEGELWIQYAANNTIRNNIFYSASGNNLLRSRGGNSNNSLDYNYWYAEAGANNAKFFWNGVKHVGFTAYRNATQQDANSEFDDPEFVDALNNDFHVTDISPVIDRGDPNPALLPFLGAFDIDGDQPRVNNGRVDIGADEIQQGPPSPPAAPSNLVATAANSSTINLSWDDNSTNETGFKIERKTGAGGTYEQIAVVAANSITYSNNTGLNSGTLYYYRVRAYNLGGDSDYSNEANATTTVPPNAPSNLTAAAISSSTINLSWNDNSTNETGFKIERKTGVNGSYVLIHTAGANATSYSNTGLLACTTYYYRVQAVNTTDNSAYSNEANATTLCNANLALGKPASASSTNGSNTPSKAVDGNTTTFWRSGSLSSTTIAWLNVDLGSTQNIGRVVVKWRGNYYAKRYQIEVSTTGSNYTTVYTDNAGNGGTDNIVFPTVAARYVEVWITRNNTSSERIDEFEIYAAASALPKEQSVEKVTSLIPDEVTLAPNFPNPFNPTTQISYAVPNAMHVTLKIYNLIGEEVATLVNEMRPAGRYTVTFDASRLTSGVYFSVLQAGEVRQVRRLVLMK